MMYAYLLRLHTILYSPLDPLPSNLFLPVAASIEVTILSVGSKCQLDLFGCIYICIYIYGIFTGYDVSQILETERTNMLCKVLVSHSSTYVENMMICQ